MTAYLEDYLADLDAESADMLQVLTEITQAFADAGET
jgi:hypothetical protein